MVNSAAVRSRASTARLRCSSVADAVLLGVQPLAQARMVSLRSRLVTMLVADLVAVAGAENIEIGVEQLGAVQRRAARRSARRAPCRSSTLPRSAAPTAAHSDDRRSGCRRRISRLDLLHRLVRLDAERARKLRHRLRHAAGALRPSASACRAGGSPRATRSRKVTSAAASTAWASARPSGAVRLARGLRAARRG